MRYLPEQNPLGSWDDVSSWLEKAYVDDSWTNPDCGNAICEEPFEYPAWGHPENKYGCAVDCGILGNVTAVKVHLDNTAPESGLFKQKRELVARVSSGQIPMIDSRDTGFNRTRFVAAVSWNVCYRQVDLREFCWFKEYQDLAVGATVDELLSLPDEEWFLDTRGDVHYLTGYLLAQGPMGKACDVICDLPDPEECRFVCADTESDAVRTQRPWEEEPECSKTERCPFQLEYRYKDQNSLVVYRTNRRCLQKQQMPR